MDILIELIIWIIRAIAKSRRGEAVGEPFDDTDAPSQPQPQQVFWRPTPPREQWAPQVHQLLEQLIARAQADAEVAQHERQLLLFVEPLEQHVIKRARELQSAPLDYHAMDTAVRELRAVDRQIRVLIRQRQNERRAARLGDADDLAQACYTPLVEFARALRLPLSSHQPVTYYDKKGQMGVLTGFVPTGLAPIELPGSFFSRITWWPALAHEIAHDFYVSTNGFDAAIRQELGLTDHAAGRYPLRVDGDAIDPSELWRIFAAWFQEIFCDVFGTLMVGPGYLWSMLAHFPSPRDRSQIVTTVVNQDGGYDEHPPRHLRVLVALRVLEHARLEHLADEARTEWAKLHRGWPQDLWFWARIGWSHDWIHVDANSILEPLNALVDRLMTAPLKALAGFRLVDVPGVDYGPHAKAETQRVADELLQGKPVHHASARWIVAGAMEAWHREPAREKEIMRRVRANIAAVGTFEHAPDAYDKERLTRRSSSATNAREAFLVHTILGPPRARRPHRIRLAG